MLEVLQTIGICVGALALVVIAFVAFMVMSTIVTLGGNGDFDEDTFGVDDLVALESRRAGRKSTGKGGKS